MNTSFATASCILLDRTATADQCIPGVWLHSAIANCILLDRSAYAAQCIPGVWSHFATTSCILFDPATAAQCISGVWSHFATASCILRIRRASRIARLQQVGGHIYASAATQNNLAVACCIRTTRNTTAWHITIRGA
jgi:hypothetical protein